MATKKIEKVLVLRTCDSDMKAYSGFTWPKRGPVSAPDWDPAPRCGNGLHGLLWGEGAGGLLSFFPDAKWLVVEVLAKDIVQLDGKVKFPKGKVVHCGSRETATAYLAQRCSGRRIVGGTATAGDYGVATAGYRGTATAGEGGTATAGDYGAATAGEGGTATAGEGGTATAGYRGTATAGVGGTATAGDYGAATAGYRGTATAGEGGLLLMRWWDGKRYRIATFYVGEDGIEAGIPYRCDAGKAIRVKKEAET